MDLWTTWKAGKAVSAQRPAPQEKHSAAPIKISHSPQLWMTCHPDNQGSPLGLSPWLSVTLRPLLGHSLPRAFLMPWYTPESHCSAGAEHRPSASLRAATELSFFLSIPSHMEALCQHCKARGPLLGSFSTSNDAAPSGDFHGQFKFRLAHLGGCTCWAGSPLCSSCKATQQCV